MPQEKNLGMATSYLVNNELFPLGQILLLGCLPVVYSADIRARKRIRKSHMVAFFNHGTGIHIHSPWVDFTPLSPHDAGMWHSSSCSSWSKHSVLPRNRFPRRSPGQVNGWQLVNVHVSQELRIQWGPSSSLISKGFTPESVFGNYKKMCDLYPARKKKRKHQDKNV